MTTNTLALLIMLLAIGCGEKQDSAPPADTGVVDGDGDGYGGDVDCDDGNPAINPGAEELCDDIDNDCDGVTDEDDAVDAATWYADADSDSYGDAATSVVACAAPSGHVADASDCDDGDGGINPAAAEVCNGADDDCDGSIDSGAVDAATGNGDGDGDGYGDAGASSAACTQPSGHVADASDCDDGDGAVNPDADEICNGVDDDCDGGTDLGASDAPTWYADVDGDGYGDETTSSAACAPKWAL